MISTKENIEELKEFEPMWKLSQFDSNYLQSALDDKVFKSISIKINRSYQGNGTTGETVKRI